MKNNFLLAVAFLSSFCLSVNAQSILLQQELNDIEANNHTFSVSEDYSNFVVGNKTLLDDISGYKSSGYESEENDDRGRLYYRESFLKGSIKTGVRYFNTQSSVSNAEIAIFPESEIFNTNFNFFRRTNTPIVAAQAEYMIFDGVGVGGFVGISTEINDATNSDTTVAKREIVSTAFGGFISRVQPIENWLYAGTELNASYETGVLKVRETNIKEDYNFSRIAANIDMSAVFAPTERIQISLGGVSIGYETFVFTGSGQTTTTSVEDDNTNEEVNDFLDNKVTGSQFGLRASPKISVLITVFTPGGR